MDVTRSQIWETLSKLSDDKIATEKFGGITYVKWMAAHATMMRHFPEYTWEFLLDENGRSAHFFPDGTAEVRCKISIGEHSHVTTLPVYQKTGKAQVNPDSNQINTAKQRCRVKAMAEFGLFQHMWSEIPAEELDAVEPDPVEPVDESLMSIYERHREEMLKAKTEKAAAKNWMRFKNHLTALQRSDTEEDLKAIHAQYVIDYEEAKG